MTSKEGLQLKRTAYFDNAKALLIFFVVLGHLLSSFLKENDMIDTLYMVIYLFHMPAFILISGHFSRKIKTWLDVKKVIQTLVFPYIVFQVFYTIYYQHMYNDPIEFVLFEPRYALWFLMSMILWKLLLSIFGHHPLSILAAIFMSLIGGLIGEINEWLSLSRTLFFFPFFLLGYYMKREWFFKLKHPTCVSVVAFLVPVSVLFIYSYGDVRWREWFYGRIPYEDIHYTIIDSAIASRLLIYGCMLICTLLFFVLVPNEKRIYTAIGEKTLGIYLLHLIFIRAFKESEFAIWIEEGGHYSYLFLVALIIVLILSNKWVWKVTKPFVTMKFK